MTVRTSAVLVLVGLECTHGASVSTQSPTPSYLVTDLGTLGGAQSEALAINELAQQGDRGHHPGDSGRCQWRHEECAADGLAVITRPL
jgi:hypothetical protein